MRAVCRCWAGDRPAVGADAAFQRFSGKRFCNAFALLKNRRVTRLSTSDANPVPNDLRRLAAGLAALQEQARALGLFVGDRDLL
jgi:hypothetical protein